MRWRGVWDAIVVGTGPVGATAALGLARSGLQVLALEARGEVLPGQEGMPGPRHAAIAPKAQEYLRTLGAWDERLDCRSELCTGMRVWEGTTDWRGLEIKAEDAALDGLMSVAEIADIESSAHEAMRREGVEVRTGSTVESLSLPGRDEHGLAEVRESMNPATEKSKLVVAADGGRSKLRELAGLRVRATPYEHDAVIGVVNGDTSGIALQRFMPSGVLALLPLRDGASGVVWSVRRAEAARLHSLGESEFASEVERALAGEWEYAPVGRRRGRERGVPRLGAGTGKARLKLSRTEAARRFGKRIALVGDAARGFHPLAGMGMNVGLADAEKLVGKVGEAFMLGQDVGSERLLAGYASEADLGSLPVATGIDAAEALGKRGKEMATLLELGRLVKTPLASFATGASSLPLPT